MQSDRVVIRFGIVKQLFGLVFFAGLAGFCVYVLAVNGARSQTEEIKLWIAAVILCGFTLYMLTRVANRDPRLIIDDYGIHNPHQWIQPLPWSKIQAVRYVSGYKKVPRISFAGPDPAEYVMPKVLNSKPNFFKPDPTRKLSYPIFADLGGLDHGATRLTKMIMAHLPHLTMERK